MLIVYPSSLIFSSLRVSCTLFIHFRYHSFFSHAIWFFFIIKDSLRKTESMLSNALKKMRDPWPSTSAICWLDAQLNGRRRSVGAFSLAPMTVVLSKYIYADLVDNCNWTQNQPDIIFSPYWCSIYLQLQIVDEGLHCNIKSIFFLYFF